ncbi:hypothetical protein GY45DRAFT_1091699 [Cubamyces sp. BRFM 1775]|nr:hypothetical protein GY45DRAFT_1091699 [Cubamyces sp. BRFM 1775]
MSATACCPTNVPPTRLRSSDPHLRVRCLGSWTKRPPYVRSPVAASFDAPPLFSPFPGSIPPHLHPSHRLLFTVLVLIQPA